MERNLQSLKDSIAAFSKTKKRKESHNNQCQSVAKRNQRTSMHYQCESRPKGTKPLHIKYIRQQFDKH